MSSTLTPLAPEARAAYGVFATFPRRRSAADLLIERITLMQAYAAARAPYTRVWKEAASQLTGAIEATRTAVDTPLISGRPIRRAAVAIVVDAIVAFEKAHSRYLPHDDHGRYTPEPGTEYDFSVSDVGRAAVQILGPVWHAESTPWGVGAYLQLQDESDGYLLAVDTEETRPPTETSTWSTTWAAAPTCRRRALPMGCPRLPNSSPPPCVDSTTPTDLPRPRAPATRPGPRPGEQPGRHRPEPKRKPRHVPRILRRRPHSGHRLRPHQGAPR